MDAAAVLRQLDETRRRVFPDQHRGEILPQLTRVESEPGDWHQIVFSALSADSADAAIAEQVRFYRARSVDAEWTLYSHDGPVDLQQRLERQGFATGEREAVMVFDLRDPAQWLSPSPSARVEVVATSEQVQTYRDVSARVFGKSQAWIAAALTSALNRGSTQLVGYVCFVGEQPAGVGRLDTHPDSPFAGLYGGGTLPEFRGRGLYRAMVAARARTALQLGARYLRVDALPTSEPILSSLGFERVAYTWPCVLERDMSIEGAGA